MCNLYRMTKGTAEVANLFNVDGDLAANYAAEVYPGYPGLVVAEGRARAMTWGSEGTLFVGSASGAVAAVSRQQGGFSSARTRPAHSRMMERMVFIGLWRSGIRGCGRCSRLSNWSGSRSA